MSGDKSHLNGSNSSEKGTNGSGSGKKGTDSQNTNKPAGSTRDRQREDTMTVVVPPSKGGKTPTIPEKPTDTEMSDGPLDSATEKQVDPKQKAIAGMFLTSISMLSLT